MKNERINKLQGIVLAMAMTVAASSAAVAQGDFKKVGGPNDLGLPKVSVKMGPCDGIDSFRAAFERKLEGYIVEAAYGTIMNPPAAVQQALSQGSNPFLVQYAAQIQANSTQIANAIAQNFDRELNPYLARVAHKMCDAAIQNFDSPTKGDLGQTNKHKQVRRALCESVQRYFPRLEARLLGVLEVHSRIALTAELPSVPDAIDPARRAQVFAELNWAIESFTSAISDEVEDQVDAFYARIIGRYCR